MTPDELLEELFAAMLERRAPNALTRDWIVRGVLRAMRRDETLDAALGLSGPGRRTLQGRALMARRNDHLRAAVQAVAVDPALSDWQRCVRLATVVRRFTADVWPHAKRLDAPLAGWDAWQVHLWHAAQCDLPLPTSARMLYEIVQDKAGFQAQKGHAKLAQYLI